MAVFMDLNITYTTDKKRLQSVIETAAHLGYSTVAINYVVDLQQKKQEIGKPKCVLELFDTFPIVQGKSRPIKVLNRLTVVASDPSHFAACMTFDVDIICVAVTEKQPFFFKRSPVNGAIERGVFFEISYTPAIRDSTMRRYTIANAISLMETCKGKNVIVTSGAEKPLELRGPYDIANLGLLFGLSEGDGKAAISTNCRAVHLHGETRKTALGIVHTMKKDQPLTERQEEEHVPPSKRAKIETV
ncbi:ribonuclease P protein subunit p30 isoform X2 [Salvelinus sp. IW2-2015]|uniref:ribonuclease P protein subunit p30 isoform X2 n=1 Tax=Salvelinus sp. IW2-2015 TaxID=2691554 RepID=UPI000CDFA54E|nr:ribonuclease P protein subunit p30 isoform X2 [Salvelinus alpinus]